MMEMVSLGSVFLLGIVELWAAIPVGLAAGLSPMAVALVTSVGAVVGVVLVAYSGEGLRRWLEKHYKPKEAAPGVEVKPSTGARIWKKYGVVGLGLLAPALTGAFAGAALTTGAAWGVAALSHH